MGNRSASGSLFSSPKKLIRAALLGILSLVAMSVIVEVLPILSFLLASSCTASTPYSATATYARVVDDKTGKPIEGVVVVAHWPKDCGLIDGSYCGEMEVLETVTDEDGNFRFPAWGPKRTTASLSWDAPTLILFKNGYSYRILENRPTENPDTPVPNPKPNHPTIMVRNSDWNGGTIQLTRFAGSEQAYANEFSNIEIDLRWARMGENCEWKKVPRLLAALFRLYQGFSAHGMKLEMNQVRKPGEKAPHVNNQAECGSAEQFFAPYLQSGARNDTRTN